MKPVQTVVFLAVAASAIADVPQYHKAAEDYKDAVRRANQIISGASYDELYLPVPNITVLDAWQYPDLVAKSIGEFISETNMRTGRIRPVIEHYCGTVNHLESSSRDASAGCNIMVDLEVKSNAKKIREEAQILLEMGRLLEMYASLDIDQESHNHNMIPFMINGKARLFDLTAQLSVVKTVLRVLH